MDPDPIHKLILYSSGFQQVVQGPPVVPEGVPGGPQLNDGELVTNELKSLYISLTLYH